MKPFTTDKYKFILLYKIILPAALCFTLFCQDMSLQAQSIRGIAILAKGGYIYAPASGTTLDQIPPANPKTFSNFYSIVGMEFYLRLSKLTVGMEGMMGLQKQQTVNDIIYEPRVTYGHLKVGYIIKDSKYFMFYPSIGSGVSRMSLIRNYKLNNENNIRLLTPSFDLGLNADYVFCDKQDAFKKYSGVMLCIKAGYRFSVMDNKWRDDKNILNGLPSYNNSGFYVSLCFGYGYFVQKVKHIKYQKKFFD